MNKEDTNDDEETNMIRNEVQTKSRTDIQDLNKNIDIKAKDPNKNIEIIANRLSTRLAKSVTPTEAHNTLQNTTDTGSDYHRKTEFFEGDAFRTRPTREIQDEIRRIRKSSFTGPLETSTQTHYFRNFYFFLLETRLKTPGRIIAGDPTFEFISLGKKQLPPPVDKPSR